ncbi:TonB-dependent receptor [Persephonella atlantica]|uniref:TonB-dependent receptor n=1 Tax=Persephonella atlantica TaxID=2699429 RepID=A0ABS1GGU2_9AQUI|nr:TonB-dependent receptor [Persephonella atlantica]MBK3332105.1 TonB-dependent receptor [Persephonella atlantica]
MGKLFVAGLLTVFVFCFLSYGDESIITLMKRYEGESELSKKTKQESLGHIIVFTRKDLDMMQAHTLSDILRLVPLVNFLPNQYGVETLLNPGNPITVPFVFRIYIDDHEVSSIHTYSPFLTYDRYPLDNINHVEIYYSAGAISVSNEPSQMIIKMYTKVPSRENSTKLRVTAGTKKSYTLSFFSAYKINDDSSFLLNFSKSYFRFPKPEINGQTVSRNQFRKNLFLKYSYFDTDVEFSAVDVRRGGFMGLSFDAAPDYSSVQSLDTYISVKQKFDRNTKLVLSYDYQKRKYKELNSQSDGGIFVPGIYSFFNPPTYYYEDLNFHKFAVSLDRKFRKGRNSLLAGTFLRYYFQNTSKNEYSDSSGIHDLKGNIFRVKNFYIGSFYLENSYNINEKNLFIAGLKYDRYKFYGQKSKGKINGRVGFISFLNHSLMLKGFISHYYILPSMILIESSKEKKLDPIRSTVFSAEAKYRTGKNEFRLFYSYYRVEDLIIIDKNSGLFVSSDKNGNFHEYGLFFRRKVDEFTTFELNYWITDVGKDKYSPERGGYLRVGREFKRFQLYTDIVYRGSYRPYGLDIPASYNLRISAGYQLPKSWYLKITGENLLNSSEKRAYISYKGDKGYFSTSYRRILITLEKVF